MGRPFLSVIICTRNRGPKLTNALESLLVQRDVDPSTVEVVVVDNGSTDNTAEVALSFGPRMPYKYKVATEPRPGVSFARNKGLEEAEGEVVAFMDDDAVALESWLAGHLEAYRWRDRVGGVMGRIIPVWEAPRPDWLDPLLEPYITVVEYGDQPFELTDPALAPVGANMSFSRKALEEAGGFDPNFGFGGLKKIPHEENDIALRMRRKGWLLLYWPAAAVRHGVPADRMTLKWFRRRILDQGRADYFFDLKHRGKGWIMRRVLLEVPVRAPVLGGAALLDLILGNRSRAARRGSVPLYYLGYLSAIGSRLSGGGSVQEEKA